MNGRSARVSRYDYSTFGAILPSGLALSPPIEINGLSGRRVHYRFGNVGLESDVAHAFSVLCRHSCRHPTGRQKSRRTNERHDARNGDTAVG